MTKPAPEMTRPCVLNLKSVMNPDLITEFASERRTHRGCLDESAAARSVIQRTADAGPVALWGKQPILRRKLKQQ